MIMNSLEINRGVGMGATIHDIHHRHRQQHLGVWAAQVLIERLAEGGRVPPWPWPSRRRECAFAPSFDLVLVPSSLSMAPSTPTWSKASNPMSAGAILPFTLPTAFWTPLPAVPRFVAVAQLERLVLAGRGAGQDSRAAESAAGKFNVDLDGRVAAGNR